MSREEVERPNPGVAWIDRAVSTRLFGVTPARIGRYHVLETLGAGGMGVVYLAEDPQLKRRVAIKLLGTRDQGDDRLLREAQAMAQLSHPNVVQVYEAGLHDEQVFLVMEYIAGGTLNDWLRAAPRRWIEVCRRFIEVGRGVAAAHGVGIVHRDLKPANILIDAAGSARVADFGLAKAGAGDVPSSVRGAGEPLAGLAAPRLSARAGTPRYMAPEQHHGQTTTQSDQFSFCVALWEALHGEPPFADDSPDRSLSAPLHRIKVPRRLERALRRGLQPDPRDRWPSMLALLAELERSLGRRSRGLMLLGVGALLAVVMFAVSALRERHARDAAEQAAADRLLVLEGRLDAALAEGREADAESALMAFVSESEHRGTAALSAAWRTWALRMQARNRRQAARLAAARAYMEADEQHMDDVMRVLATIFRDQAAWNSAALLVESLRERGSPTATDPEFLALAADSARYRRDFPGFLAALQERDVAPVFAEQAPIVTALARGTQTRVRAGAARELEIDGIPALLLHEGPAGRGSIQVVRAEPTLRPLAAWPASEWQYLVHIGRAGEPSTPLLLGSSAGITVLRELTFDGPRELLRWPAAQPISATTADLDGDGRWELYVGTGPYERQLRSVVRGADGALRVERPDPLTDAAKSDINALAAADLDGDGRQELVVAAGPWVAFDVRVLRAGPGDGELELVARRKLGQVAQLAVLPTSGGTRVLVAKSNQYPSRMVFPADKPMGEPAGLYVLALDRDELSIEQFLPWPTVNSDDMGLRIFWLGTGDIDGDGRVDAVARLAYSHGLRSSLAVFRQLADGRLTLIEIAGMSPLVVAQLDADPAAEILAQVHTDGRDDPLWILGAGETPVPALATASTTALASPHDADPVVARAWSRAEELARLGLVTEAAQTLVDQSNLEGNARAWTAALLRAAELYRRADACAQALAIFEQPGLHDQTAALTGAMDCHARLGEYAAALTAARQVLGRADADPTARANASELVDRLGDTTPSQVLLDFTAPLEATWDVAAPTALRHDLPGGRLMIDAMSGQGELASLPVRCDGSILAVEVDVTVDRAEWASGLDVVVRNGDGADLLGVSLRASGGGGFVERTAHCIEPGVGAPPRVVAQERRSAGQPSRHTLRAEFQTGMQRTTCRAQTADGPPIVASAASASAIPRGPCALVLRAIGGPPNHLMRASIPEIRLAGVSRVQPAEAPPADRTAALLLVGGDPSGSLQALARATRPAPEHAIWRALALAELGAGTEAIATLQQLDLAPNTAVWQLLVRALRTRSTLRPWVRSALGERAFRLHAEGFVDAVEDNIDDPELRRAVLDASSDPTAHVHVGDDPEELRLRGTMSLLRARTWIEVEQYDRAELELARGEDDIRRVAGWRERLPPRVHPGLLAAKLAAARGRPRDAARRVQDLLADPVDATTLADFIRLDPHLAPYLNDVSAP